MKPVLILFTVLFSTFLKGQGSYHVVDPFSEWKYETHDVLIRFLSIVTEDGDTTMGGDLCQRLKIKNYRRQTQGSSNSWGPLQVLPTDFLYLRKNGLRVEVYRNDIWNLIYKTQTYIGEIWYQGQSESGDSIFVKVIDNDNWGTIYTSPCNSSGEIIDSSHPDYHDTYGPFWGEYNVNYVSSRIADLNRFFEINFIYCPILNYSCYNGSPVVGSSCSSNMLTLELEQEALDELTIYPNPGQNEISFLGDFQQVEVSIYDISGTLVLQQKLDLTLNKIDVSHLKSGTYLIGTAGELGVKFQKWSKM